MPFMINGFGTWNVGRKNVHATVSQCDQCSSIVTLKSYDTRRYIMAVFIPVIPLGRLRVVNHCGRCDRFRVMKLTQWNAGLAEMRSKVEAAMQEDLDSKQVVEQVLAPVIGFQDMDTFARVASPLRQRYAGDPYVLMHLGNTYTYFNSFQGAEEAYNASLNAGDSQECRESLAWLYLLQERPDEAWPTLEHILATKNGEKAGLLFHLAISYQAVGKHQQAINVIDEVFAAFPDLSSAKDWTKLRKTSEKNLASGKPIKKGSLSQVYEVPKQQTGRWALILAPIIVLILLGAYIFACVDAAKNRTVHVVNGLTIPYDVQIDEITVQMQPNSRRVTYMDEGTHRYRVDTLEIPEQTFDLHTNFFLRPFQENEVFVLNPDQVAILTEEDTEYMEHVDDSARYEYRIVTNEAFYRFHNVHFPFQAFPDELEMDRNREMRRRVDAVLTESIFDVLGILASEGDDEALRTNLTRRFHLQPQEPASSEILISLLGLDEFAQEAASELAARPPLIEVHRAYQNAVDIQQPDADLESQYESLLAQDPDNGDLIYLLARVTDDPDKAIALFKQAASPPYNSQYAVAALAFDSLTRGSFEEAKVLVQSVDPATVSEMQFGWLADEVRMACQEYDAILNGIPRSPSGVPLSENDAWTDVHFRTLRGDTDEEFEEWLGAFCAYLPSIGYEKAGIDQFREVLRSQRMYAAGDLDTYFATVDTEGDPQLAFERALYESNLDAASALLGDEPLATDPLNHLTLFLCAAQSGQQDLADAHLAKGAELLGEGDGESRDYAAILKGEAPLDIERALRNGTIPFTKRVVLAALGARFPEHAEPLHELARKLNYSRSFPYYVLSGALAAPEPAIPVAPELTAAPAASAE